MPFLFIVVGIFMVVSAARGTSADLLSLLKGDFSGKGNFVYWTISILLIGSIGYIQQLRPVSRAMLVLVVVVLVIANKGVFAQFTSALNQTQTTPKTQPATLSPQNVTGITSTLSSAQSLYA